MILKLDKLKINLIEWCFVLVLILNANTIWTSYDETLLNKLLKVVTVLLPFLYVGAIGLFERKVLNNTGVVAVVAAAYMLAYTVIINFRVISFMYFIIDAIAIYFMAQLLINTNRYHAVFLKYSDLIFVVACVSLFFWFFGSVMHIISPTGSVLTLWSDNEKGMWVPSYYGVYFETQRLYGIIRNSGIFTEAPMFNLNLCIALLIELFIRDDIRKIRSIILIVAIVSTLSATGYCIVILAVFLKVLNENKKNSIGYIIKIAIVPVALIVGIILVQGLLLDKLSSGSGMVRLDDFKAGFLAWKESPLFGVGYGNMDAIQKYMSSFRLYNTGFSNSLMQIIAQGGIALATIYFVFAIRWIKKALVFRDYRKLCFILAYLSLFVVTISSYKFITLFIFMMGDIVLNRKLQNGDQVK